MALGSASTLGVWVAGAGTFICGRGLISIESTGARGCTVDGGRLGKFPDGAPVVAGIGVRPLIPGLITVDS